MIILRQKNPTIFIACLSGITGKLKLEGISGGHLAQPAFSKQGHLDQVAQNCVQLCFFNISKDGDYINIS